MRNSQRKNCNTSRPRVADRIRGASPWQHSAFRNPLVTAERAGAGHSAFTLVEMLVVVSIIALLISILLPSLSKARQQGKQVVCAARLKQISQGIWNYWAEHNEHVPYVETPMTNGVSVPGFGNSTWTDDQINPFDHQRWPKSLANVLTPTYMALADGIFACPAATVGWPRSGGPFEMTYRPSAANQPNGLIDPSGTYFREHFGFMDGRVYRRPLLKSSGNRIADAINAATRRGTFLRDMVRKAGPKVIGPHRGGVNVINKWMDVEHRDQKQTNEDLAPFGQGVLF